MNSYKIYLTRSCEATHLIARGLREATPWERRGHGHTLCIAHGPVADDDRIPAIYHNDGWFFACIEYVDEDNVAKHEITVC